MDSSDNVEVNLTSLVTSLKTEVRSLSNALIQVHSVAETLSQEVTSSRKRLREAHDRVSDLKKASELWQKIAVARENETKTLRKRIQELYDENQRPPSRPASRQYASTNRQPLNLINSQSVCSTERIEEKCQRLKTVREALDRDLIRMKDEINCSAYISPKLSISTQTQPTPIARHHVHVQTDLIASQTIAGQSVSTGDVSNLLKRICTGGSCTPQCSYASDDQNGADVNSDWSSFDQQRLSSHPSIASSDEVFLSGCPTPKTTMALQSPYQVSHSQVEEPVPVQLSTSGRNNDELVGYLQDGDKADDSDNNSDPLDGNTLQKSEMPFAKRSLQTCHLSSARQSAQSSTEGVQEILDICHHGSVPLTVEKTKINRKKRQSTRTSRSCSRKPDSKLYTKPNGLLLTNRLSSLSRTNSGRSGDSDWQESRLTDHAMDATFFITSCYKEQIPAQVCSPTPISTTAESLQLLLQEERTLYQEYYDQLSSEDKTPTVWYSAGEIQDPSSY